MKLQKYRFIKDFGIYSKDNVVEINKEEAKMLKDYVVKVIPYEEQKSCDYCGQRLDWGE